jgi:hypothetical protein
MGNFGNIPPRSIQAFGVASVLGGGCRVYYDNLFNSSGLGRVSDLIFAKLRPQGLDELKLRAVLLFSFFEAYYAETREGALEEPLTIECGIDDEKVAVGISFAFQEGDDWFGEGFQDRVTEQKPNNPFETLLCMIYANSDHAFVRRDDSRNRVEIVSFLALPGKIEIGQKQPFEVVVLDPEIADQNVAAEEYVQLGDLPYDALLKETVQKREKSAEFATGAILSKTFSAAAPEPQEEKTFKADRKDDDESSGSVQRFSNTQESKKEDVIRVRGSRSEESSDQSVVRISSAQSSSSSNEENAGEKRRFSVQSMLGKVWPFSKKEQEPASESGDDSAENAVESEAKDSQASSKAEPASAQVTEVVKASASESTENSEVDEKDAESMAQYLSNNCTNGSFSKLVERSQEMARVIKQDSKDQAAKRWAESFSQEIMAEKIRLVTLSQKINQAIRQKELDLRNRESKFAEDLRRKDEALHHKNISLNRAKEQIAQLTAQLERQKGNKAAQGEEANLKQKYQLSQRMLTSLREENTKLTEKIEDMKAQNLTTQKASESSAQVELANLKTKQDQIVRQNMQLKSLNEQLMRRLNQNSAKSSEKVDRASLEEVKKKLEAANSMSESQQKELTLLKAKLDQSSKQESKWVSDLAKKEAELSKAKAELEKLQAATNAQKKAG